jgi:uncharacterized protein (DUF1697 family)
MPAKTRSTATPSPRTVIALLRGVNVGGNNKVPMKELVPALASLGLEDVRTYIQSGNLIFRVTGSPPDDAELGALLERRIAKTFNLRIPVVLRTREELADVVANNPFVAQGAKPETLHVGFLSHPPVREMIAKLDPKRSPPDAFLVAGKEIFFMFPKGLGRTKLTNAYFDKQLATTTTVRNWNTVKTLLSMAR